METYSPFTQSQVDALLERASDCICGAHRYVGHDDEYYCYVCDGYLVQQMSRYVAKHQSSDDVQDPTVQQGIINLFSKE